MKNSNSIQFQNLGLRSGATIDPSDRLSRKTGNFGFSVQHCPRFSARFFTGSAAMMPIPSRRQTCLRPRVSAVGYLPATKSSPIDSRGHLHNSPYRARDREYFQIAMDGETHVSNPAVEGNVPTRAAETAQKEQMAIFSPTQAGRVRRSNQPQRGTNHEKTDPGNRR